MQRESEQNKHVGSFTGGGKKVMSTTVFILQYLSKSASWCDIMEKSKDVINDIGEKNDGSDSSLGAISRSQNIRHSSAQYGHTV